MNVDFITYDWRSQYYFFNDDLESRIFILELFFEKSNWLSNIFFYVFNYNENVTINI